MASEPRQPDNWLGSAAQREQLLDAFEEAWRRRARPPLEQFLPEGPERLATLLELAQTELELRLRAGEAARAEDYLARFPDLADDSGAAVALVLWEIRLRCRLGEHVTAPEAVRHEMVRQQPTNPEIHFYLGVVLYQQRKLDEAVAAFRMAIRLKPDLFQAHTNLGIALRGQKKLDEALAAFRQADQLLPGHPIIRRELRETWQLLRLDRKLSACLAGKEQPDSPRQAAELAWFCASFHRRYPRAVRFYVDAFKADPNLADDLRAPHRYRAAACAALALAGKGEAAALADSRRTELRRQALTWLPDDLAAWRNQHYAGDGQTNAALEKHMRHWQSSPDLAAVRDQGALARLPEGERQPWQKLWASAEDLRRRAAAAAR
jgi:tetratricopeptide (TPR) repeat protein